jgi:hypothetical protein
MRDMMVSEEDMIPFEIQVAGFDFRCGKDCGIGVALLWGDNG